GLVTVARDLNTLPIPQLVLVGYPGSRVQRLTNDFNQYSSVSVSSGDEAIAAVRETRLANLWMMDGAGGTARQITSITSPEGPPSDLAGRHSGSAVYAAMRAQGLRTCPTPTSGATTTALTSGTGLSLNCRAAPGVIVFNRFDASGMHVWRMGPDGSGVRQLTSGAGERLNSLSPDGRFAIFARVDSLAATFLLS